MEIKRYQVQQYLYSEYSVLNLTALLQATGLFARLTRINPNTIYTLYTHHAISIITHTILTFVAAESLLNPAAAAAAAGLPC